MLEDEKGENTLAARADKLDINPDADTSASDCDFSEPGEGQGVPNDSGDVRPEETQGVSNDSGEVTPEERYGAGCIGAASECDLSEPGEAQGVSNDCDSGEVRPEERYGTGCIGDCCWLNSDIWLQLSFSGPSTEA